MGLGIKMFKRLIGDLVAKSFGVASTNEYTKHNLALFLDRNGITRPDLFEYRVDRSKYQSHFFRIALVGKAYKGSKLIGLIIQYDESIGTISGNIVPIEQTIKHGMIHKSFKAGKYSYDTLYDAFLFEMEGYYLDYETSTMKPLGLLV